MGYGKTEYTELSSSPITAMRDAVVSKCSRGGYTLAQRFTAMEGGKPTTVFLKGAFHIDSIQHMEQLRDALNVAIEAEKAQLEADEWDEVI